MYCCTEMNHTVFISYNVCDVDDDLVCVDHLKEP